MMSLRHPNICCSWKRYPSRWLVGVVFHSQSEVQPLQTISVSSDLWHDNAVVNNHLTVCNAVEKKVKHQEWPVPWAVNQTVECMARVQKVKEGRCWYAAWHLGVLNVCISFLHASKSTLSTHLRDMTVLQTVLVSQVYLLWCGYFS